MALVAIFSIGYALPEFDLGEGVKLIDTAINAKSSLYLFMLIGFFIILILDVIVAILLYQFFKEDHLNISRMAGILRLVYTAIFAVAIYFLAEIYLASQVSSESIQSNFNLFHSVWNMGLIIFGIHVVLLGLLMKMHSMKPNILWYITLVAGISYVVLSALKLTIPNTKIVDILQMILSLPMTIGEIGLAIWLIIKGGKVKY
ncbi:hypothetical protein GCM10007940_36710 [Portibacter lacus]|uniref:DUF4386 domain-containing protein n=2 Tax=Portibacter lacus TaxID=1099794 RepID=A0AA37SWI4_9BACT|nr:hypothetical protein GCM10007940_36710 [Portibacter lacus]